MIHEPAIPLSQWASEQLARLGKATGSPRISELRGATLLGERAMMNGFQVPGEVAAGGGCRFFKAIDGWVALNLARPDDRDLLPALFSNSRLDTQDDKDIAAFIAPWNCWPLVERGREMGLAIAAEIEPVRPSPAYSIAVEGSCSAQKAQPPLVIDLSGLWAGPLSSHLLWLQGAQVVKVESLNRPDSMRTGDPRFFALLNQGKDSVTVDLQTHKDRQALIQLLKRADIVIEAARPRALLQLGINAAQIVRETPGLVWVTITGHGGVDETANWVGFGDDCGVAGGLSAALHEASGHIGFVGDAIADPLTGIMAARLAYERWASGRGARMILSMSGVVAQALAAERNRDQAALDQALRLWGQSVGQSFPKVKARQTGIVRPLGIDSPAWLESQL